mmetsp:Transcript_3362/g.10386  ORF Transcript_3362/g.10386 Transcript_3362/m.10386 type:complete len:159 (-) Transcript_3362:610-1086(-)
MLLATRPPGVREIEVTSREEVLKCVHYGSTQRTTGATLMNGASSRSHSLFTMRILRRSDAGSDFVSSKVRASQRRTCNQRTPKFRGAFHEWRGLARHDARPSCIQFLVVGLNAPSPGHALSFVWWTLPARNELRRPAPRVRASKSQSTLIRDYSHWGM